MSATLLTLALAAFGLAQQDKAERYGVAVDAKAYPQATPKEALKSVLAAAEAKKMDYVVAQLADPTFIDERVKKVYGGKFEEQVEETKGRLGPLALKQLKRFLD